MSCSAMPARSAMPLPSPVQVCAEVADCIDAAAAARREDDRVAAEAVDRAVFHAQRDHAAALAILHDQVEREIFDVEVRVILQALLVERVEHGMAGAVRRGAGALHGRAFAHILHVAAERALVDRAIFVAAERHAGMFELVHRLRRFADHVLDRVLVAEPVRTLDGIEHVPLPVIRRVVAERGGDAPLCRHGVRARREHLGDAGGLQAGLGAAHRGAQTRAAGADHHCVIGVIDDLVGGHQSAAPAVTAILRIEKMAVVPAASVKKLSSTISTMCVSSCW
jgi:hypothetical protein